mgnify:CR=1 FL=1
MINNDDIMLGESDRKAFLQEVSGNEKQPKPKEVRRIAKVIFQNPIVRREYYPKAYDTPSTHHCPSMYSAMEFSMLAGRELAGTNHKGYNFNADVISKVHQELHFYRYPTYFITEDLLGLMSMTDIASSVDMSKIKYPHNSCLFMFPKGSYKIHEGDEIIGIAFSRSFDVQTLTQEMEAKRKGLPPTTGRFYDPEITHDLSLIMDSEEFNKKDYEDYKRVIEKKYGEPVRFVEGIQMGFPYANGQMSCISYPIEDGSLNSILQKHEHMYTHYDEVKGSDISSASPDSVLLKDDNNEIVTNRLLSDTDDIFYRTGGKVTEQSAQDDVKMMQKLCRLGVTLILYMGAKQEEWQNRTSETKPPRRCKKMKKLGGQKWGVNWLGKKYEGYISKQEEHGEKSVSGRKVRYHWRKGYCGIRWHGKGRSRQKQVWVMPYAVNKPME